jgi:hypothetical protein
MAAATDAVEAVPNHADPTLIAEANLLEQSTLQNIREYRHRDIYGNVICKFKSSAQFTSFSNIGPQRTRIFQTQLDHDWRDR